VYPLFGELARKVEKALAAQAAAPNPSRAAA
jgi:hypothetical protein